MQYYKLCVDTDDMYGLIEILDKYSSKYLVCQENLLTDNAHCHAYLETLVKQATIRAAVVKVYGSGNSSYSLKELDEQYPLEYLAYCLKENNYKHTLPQDIIDKAKEHNKLVKAGMADKKAKRRTQLQCIEDEYFSTQLAPGGACYDKQYVCDSVVQYYENSGILVRKFMLVSLCQTLCLKYVPSYNLKLSQDLFDSF